MPDSYAMPGTPVDLPLPPEICTTFGYSADARYVGFHWSTCGDELVVDDGLNSGTGQSWSFLAFRNHPAVKPLLAGFNLGYSDADAEHWLLLDRQRSRATIAPPSAARTFLENQHPPAVPLTAEQRQELQDQLEDFMSQGWREEHVDPEQIRRAMDGQRGRVKRMVSWLDQCPVPPQEGRRA